MFRKYIPIFGFIIITIVFFWQFIFKGLYPIPADTIVGLYYPYREVYAQTNPNGIPFKNFLITDPVRQQYPWRDLVVDSFSDLKVPTWNPYSLSGTPNVANFQSASFNPLNILFFMFSFPMAWSFLILLQPILAGIFLYLYLRNLKLDEYSGFFGAVIFGFSGFSAMWLEWGTVVQTGLWLPLVLLSVDKTFNFFEKKNPDLKNINFLVWPLILTLSMVFSFFAGHLQTFFYLFVFSLIYILLRVIKSRQRLKIAITYFSSILIFIVLTLPQSIPTLRFISLSARELDQLNWQKEGWFLPIEHLVQFIAPDFFGNPTTLNYWGTWNYGELTTFVGVSALILAVYAMYFRRDRKTKFFALAFVTALLLIIASPISKLPFILNIPFLSTAQPTRLIFITTFSLSVLSALGLNYLINKGKIKQIFIPIIIVSVILILLFISVQFKLINTDVGNLMVAKRNLILPAGVFLLSSMLLIIITITKKNIRKFFILALILLAILEIFRFSWKFNPFTDPDYLYPETASIKFIKENLGYHRIATSDPRIMAPNFFMIHNISSVEGYDPLYMERYGEFISAINRNEPDINPPFGFNRIIRVENFGSELVDMLGIKYVLSLSELSEPGFKEVLQDGETRIYENENVLPRAWFVKEILYAQDKEEAIKLLFEPEFDPRRQAVVEESITGVFNSGKVFIEKYNTDEVVIKTENESRGFLVLTDSYYPTWRVKINGNDGKIYRVNFNFRGVVVPEGKNTIIFKNSLL
jgi:uncharacterized membrane protein YfhO